MPLDNPEDPLCCFAGGLCWPCSPGFWCPNTSLSWGCHLVHSPRATAALFRPSSTIIDGTFLATCPPTRAHAHTHALDTPTTYPPPTTYQLTAAISLRLDSLSTHPSHHVETPSEPSCREAGQEPGHAQVAAETRTQQDVRRLQKEQAYAHPTSCCLTVSLSRFFLLLLTHPLAPQTDPRWASWNLGVFICIRCSGIHRSMGVHISRVKSVDLDSWTDEQMQSILSWGNARANKYWEDKLAPGHTPSEAKIENFIRTKYELKRWVMDGPIPDPASLDADGDDDVPLSLVKEKQTIERKESLRRSGGPSSAPSPPPQSQQPAFDILGSDDPVPRASTAGPGAANVPPKAAPAPPKATHTNSSSLLGLDFLGAEPSPPSRPASTTGVGGAPSGPSRPDLKQSILSLYATAPRPQQAQQPSHSHSNSFGSMHSPTVPAAPQPQQQSSLNDAFSNLSFANLSSPRSPPTSSPAAFSGLGGLSSSKSPPPQQSSSAFSGLGGGSFFDAKPAAASPKPAPAQSSFGGFGDFSAPAQPAAAAPAKSSTMNDLFDFSASSSSPAPAPAATTTTASSSSVFNLSQSKSSPPVPAATTTSSAMSGGADIWGGNAWADPAPAPAAHTPQPAPVPSGGFGGWGGMSGGSSLANTSIVPGASGGLVTQPKVSADEEFGGWTSSTGATTTTTTTTGAGGEDLFSNVWE